MKRVPPFNTFLEIIIKLVLFCLTTSKKKETSNVREYKGSAHEFTPAEK